MRERMKKRDAPRLSVYKIILLGTGEFIVSLSDANRAADIVDASCIGDGNECGDGGGGDCANRYSCACVSVY